MNFKSSHHSLNTVPRLALTTALAALLAACGDGPLENKGPNAPGNGSSSLYEDWRNGRNGQNEQAGQQAGASTPSNASDTDAGAAGAGDNGKTAEQLAAEAAAREQMRRAALDLALAMRDHPVDALGKKMVVVGLDNASISTDNSEWLSSAQFSRYTDEEKAEMKRFYVSLSGKDLYEYYRRACPVTSEENDTEAIYKCIAGIYYGKNGEGKACFTSIGWNGEIRHVNDTSVVSQFVPGKVRLRGNGKPSFEYRFASDGSGEIQRLIAETEAQNQRLLQQALAANMVPPEAAKPPYTMDDLIPPMKSEFTRADVGENMFMILNGAERSNNVASYTMDPEKSFRIQQIVFKFDSSAKNIEIFQKNNDFNHGTGDLSDTCFIDFNGPGNP